MYQSNIYVQYNTYAHYVLFVIDYSIDYLSMTADFCLKTPDADTPTRRLDVTRVRAGLPITERMEKRVVESRGRIALEDQAKKKKKKKKEKDTGGVLDA